MRHIRLYWRAPEEGTDSGWFLDTPLLLTGAQLHSLIRRSFLPKQIDRFRSLPPSDKKDQLKLGIEQLKRGEVRQRLVDAAGGTNGDLVVFAAAKPGGHQQYSIGKA